MTFKTIDAPLGINERRLLNIVREHGIVARFIITKHMDVTPQAVGQIVGRLDRYELLVHHKAQKIGLGQPPKPLSIRADGAFSVGIKVGRRRTDIVLMDILGEVRNRHAFTYAYPVASELLPQIQTHLQTIEADLTSQNQPLVGIGLAAPFSIGGWHTTLGLSQTQANEWKQIDLQAAIQAMTSRPVRFAKDTAAACTAELLNGLGRKKKNFLYFFMDTFIGGGVVHKGHWLSSSHGNAGAVASLPIGKGQLLDHASLWHLEQKLVAANLDPMAAYDERALDPVHLAHTETWLAVACPALAASIVSGTAFLDFDTVVIDGATSTPLLAKMIRQTKTAMSRFNWEGMWQPKVLQGSMGPDAGVLGGALMPLNEFFYA